MKNFRELQLTQMESRLRKWRQAKLPSRPTAGWVKSIRESLGMSASALGRRLGMSHSAINKFELAEANDAITLASLKKIAEITKAEYFSADNRQDLLQIYQSLSSKIVLKKHRRTEISALCALLGMLLVSWGCAWAWWRHGRII